MVSPVLAPIVFELRGALLAAFAFVSVVADGPATGFDALGRVLPDAVPACDYP